MPSALHLSYVVPVVIS